MFSVSSAFVDKFKTGAPRYWFSYIEAFLATSESNCVSKRLVEKLMHLKHTSLGFAKTSEMNGGTLYLQQYTFRAFVTEYW